MSFCHLELDTKDVDMPVRSAGDVSLSDEGKMPVSSVVFAQASSDTQWNPMFLQNVGLLCLSRYKPNTTRLAMLHSTMNPFVLAKDC